MCWTHLKNGSKKSWKSLEASDFLNEIDLQHFNHLETPTIIAPKIANETPITFLEVKGSFRNILAKIIINTVESWL